MAEINVSILNCQGQTKMSLAKQLHIQHHLKVNSFYILLCQEIFIDEEAFTNCEYIQSNYIIIKNNALNEYGTACFIRNSFSIRDVSFDTEGQVIVFNMGGIMIGNI